MKSHAFLSTQGRKYETKCIDSQQLIFSCFPKKDLVLSLFATLLLPESPTRYSIFLIIFLLFKVFPFDQFLIKEPTAKVQLFFL